MEAMGAAGQQDLEIGDVSELEEESLVKGEEPVEEFVEIRLFKSVLRFGSRLRVEIPTYNVNLDLEELIDQRTALEKYFDYEDVDEEKQVKFAITRLRGHGTLWWDGVQEEMESKNKAMIKRWSRIISKLKGKFLPKYYQWTLFRKMQNLRQKLTIVKEYTKEFYKINTRVGHLDDTPKRVARYINGLRFEIQDDHLNLFNIPINFL